MGFHRFGFGTTQGSATGTSGSTTQVVQTIDATIKVNQPTMTADGITFKLPTASRSYSPKSLKVYVNGQNQDTDVDFKELPDGKSFQWLDTSVPLNPGKYDVVVDFLLS